MSRTFRGRDNSPWYFRDRPKRMPKNKSFFSKCLYTNDNKPTNRDGRWKDSSPGRLKFYTNWERTSNEKVFLNKIKQGTDVEELMYPNEKQTKYLWWKVY